MKSLAALLLFALSGAVFAATTEIPRSELAFIDKIQTVDRATIIEQLGEPGRVLDVLDKDSGEITGYIWLFHYINTNEEGEYYKTTELDLIGDKVVTVVFINSDFEDAPFEEPIVQTSAEVF